MYHKQNRDTVVDMMTEEGEADLLCASPRAAASASRGQLSAHNLGHYYKVFLGIDTDPKDQPPMKVWVDK